MSLEQLPAAAPSSAEPPVVKRRRAPAGRRGRGDDRPLPVLRRELLAAVSVHSPGADGEVIARAFDFAALAHEGQLRATGEPYVTHPIAAARTLAELGLDTSALAAALLHDVPEDTEYGLSMAVITEDYRRMRYYRDECEYGMGYVNLPCIGAEVHLPFGGVKKSGNGHPSAAALVDAVTHKTAFTVNHGTEIKMAQGLTADLEGA